MHHVVFISGVRTYPPPLVYTKAELIYQKRIAQIDIIKHSTNLAPY